MLKRDQGDSKTITCCHLSMVFVFFITIDLISNVLFIWKMAKKAAMTFSIKKEKYVFRYTLNSTPNAIG